MNSKKAQRIVARLINNTNGLRYGSVAVSLKLCEGRIVDVIYTVCESMRETETKNMNKAEKE